MVSLKASKDTALGTSHTLYRFRNVQMYFSLFFFGKIYNYTLSNVNN
jgi:hypothetical protein